MLGNKIHSSILGGFQSRPTYRTVGPGPEQRQFLIATRAFPLRVSVLSHRAENTPCTGDQMLLLLVTPSLQGISLKPALGPVSPADDAAFEVCLSLRHTRPAILAALALHHASETVYQDVLGLAAESRVWAVSLASLTVNNSRFDLAQSSLHAADTFEVLAPGNGIPVISELGASGESP